MHDSKRPVEEKKGEMTHVRADQTAGEPHSANLELALSLSEMTEALKKISAGDPTVRIDEKSDNELIRKLKHMINLTAAEIGEIVDLSHEFAMGLAEHFDVLHRVSKGDLNARVTGVSSVELLESLKKFTNQMIESIEVKNIERDHAEKVLREMEALESSILRTIPHVVMGLRERRIFFANEAVQTVFGWTPRELIGQSTRILYRSDEEYEEIGRLFYPTLEKQETFTHEYTCRHKDGRDIYCKVSASVIGERLRDQGIVVVYEDKTANKFAEEALRESEQRLRNIIEHSNEIFYIHDTNHRFTYISPQCVGILGYHPEEMMTEWTKFITDNPVNDKAIKLTETALKTGQRQKPYLLECCRKDGTTVLLEIDESPLTDAEGNIVGIVGAARDITEHKRMEEEKDKLRVQLLHAQKMEAVGQLAGGIAHDFNNILTAIIGYGHFLKIKMKEDDPLRSYADQILSLSDRAANLTQGLLALSRKQIINSKPVNINEIITNVKELLLRVIGEDIELETILTDRQVTIMGDAGQVEQVLMNLATNARDAMPEGGRLTIETDIAEIDEKFIEAHGFGVVGSYVLISETDTGDGMDRHTKERVFEPFYTTKEMGKGTGLGLSIVYGIVKQHEGYIDVYSELGKGTTFKIYLPLIEGPAEEEIQEAVFSLKRGQETLLYGEDDDKVRALTKEALEEFGYEVIEALDGEDAINKFTENKERIQLILLDVIMPKKNGKEVYKEIRKINPYIKALFMSGYTADVIHKKGIGEESLDFISKPVSPTVLLKKIREMLDI